MEVRIWSGKTHISKWPKSGWNWWNMINIVHIYAKQCEIMQKINETAQTAKFTVFAREISSAVLKTWKTRKTKTWITQNFQILYHIQGTTIGKLTSWGFRKCGSFCPGEFLKRSYWLSKSSNFSIFFESKRRCQKKRHGHNFDFSGLKRIAGLVHPISYPTYSFQVRKIKIVAVSFFLDTA